MLWCYYTRVVVVDNVQVSMVHLIRFKMQIVQRMWRVERERCDNTQDPKQTWGGLQDMCGDGNESEGDNDNMNAAKDNNEKKKCWRLCVMLIQWLE